MTNIPYVPKETCGHGVHSQYPDSVPTFHFVQTDGRHGIADLQTIRLWAEHIYENDAPHTDVYQELYVILPGGRGLLPCFLQVAGTAETPKLEIVGTASVSGVLYATDL